jgi:hypothetical protein
MSPGVGRNRTSTSLIAATRADALSPRMLRIFEAPGIGCDNCKALERPR